MLHLDQQHCGAHKRTLWSTGLVRMTLSWTRLLLIAGTSVLRGVLSLPTIAATLLASHGPSTPTVPPCMDWTVGCVAYSPTWMSPALMLLACSQDITSAGKPTVHPLLLRMFLVTHIYIGLGGGLVWENIYFIGLGYNSIAFSIIKTIRYKRYGFTYLMLDALRYTTKYTLALTID